MITKDPLKSCRKCGVALESDSHAGLCPPCLVQVGIDLQVDDVELSEPFRDSEDPARALPRRFGDYELLEEIARGGMGVVFKARQISLNRIVAVKMILAGQLATKEMVLRFRAEAESAANLHHPNIVAIHETGEIEGQHYFSMHYVAGPDLGRLAREGPVNPRQAARYLEKIAQAVHYAHEHGVLHRDLKPSNVLIDDEDEPRVTDFGLAKKFTVDSGLTISGQLLGSPNFMPPEQASHKRGKVSRRSDVYGLGGLLYHLLTARPPFHAATLEETLQQVFEREPVSPRALNPSVPRDLETICLKCLEKEPSRRYPTAQAVGDELGRFLCGEPVLARPIGTVGRTWRWCRRNPGLAALGATVNVLLVALALGGLTVAHQQRDSAQEYRDLAETNRVLLYASELKAARQAIEDGNMSNAVTFLRRHIPKADQDDVREFTWRYLNHLCQPYLHTPFLDHGIDVIWLAATQDGKRLAAGGALGLVTVWDVESRAQIQPPGFETGEDILTGPLALSPTGRFVLASGFDDWWSRHGVQIWDTTSWKQVGPSMPPGRYCDFSPDGSLLAVPAGTNVVLFNVGRNWEEIRRLTGHTDDVWSARFSNNGRKLVTAGDDGAARVWSVGNGECLGVFTNHTAAVQGAAFSPDDEQIASVSSDKTVRLWTADSMRQLDLYEHDACVGALDFNSTRWMVASGGHDGVIKVWDTRAKTLRTLRGHSGNVRAVKFILGGTALASGSQDHTIKLWNLDGPQPEDTLVGRAESWCSPLAFSPDAALLATVTPDAAEILLWDAATGTPAGTRTGVRTNRLGRIADLRTLLSAAEDRRDVIPIEAVALEDLAFSRRDGLLVAVRSFTVGGDPRSRIEFWDIRRGALMNSFAGWMPFSLSPDGRRVACLDRHDGDAIVFRDAEPGGRVWRSEQALRQSPLRRALAFSSNGEILASSGYELQLWEAATGKLVRTLASLADRPVEPPLYSLAFTPDGELLIASGEGPEVLVWEMTAPRRTPHKLRGHLGQVNSVAISPDGRTLASGDSIGRIKLWGLERNRGEFVARELLTLREQSDSVLNLQFSPDGTVLASGSADGVVRLWRAPPLP